MIGAIAGDIIGSVYENEPIKHKAFPLFQRSSVFTDDTVLTVAIADATLTGKSYREALWEWGGQYPNAGYGASFINWLRSLDPQPYDSWGNGAAMRVCPIGYVYDTAEKVIDEAEKSALVSHSHREGVNAAQAVALAVFLARSGLSKRDIKHELSHFSGYDLERSLCDIRPCYEFDVSSRGSVPEAIICFLESTSFEDAVRNAVSLGGDSDTQACIAGAIAEAYFRDISATVIREVKSRLSTQLWSVTSAFGSKYCC